MVLAVTGRVDYWKRGPAGKSGSPLEPVAGIQVRDDVDALVRTIGKGNHLVPEIVKIG